MCCVLRNIINYVLCLVSLSPNLDSILMEKFGYSLGGRDEFRSLVA